MSITNEVVLQSDETAEWLISDLIKLQGNTVAAAATLGVARSTLWKWRVEEHPLNGPPLVAIRAILAHPEEYTEYKTLVRPAHRVATPED